MNSVYMRVAMITLMGCTSDDTHEGTVVGNPGDAAFRVAEGLDTSFERASGFIESVELSDCDGGIKFVELDEEFDFLEPHAVELPAGTWCEAYLTMPDAFEIEGVVRIEDEDEDEGNIEFFLYLELDGVRLQSEQGFVIDENSHVIEFATPGWLHPVLLEEAWEAQEDLEDEDDELLVVDAEHPFHGDFVELVETGSGLYADDDGDGYVDDDEREAGPVASGEGYGEDEEPDESDTDGDRASSDFGTGDERLSPTGGGCGQSESSLAWLLPLCLLTRRRLKMNG